LALRGLRVTVVNQSPLLGERLRRESDPPVSILGCHRATWTLLRSFGVRSTQPLFAESRLEFLLPDGRVARYPTSRLPAPLHQFFTIGRFAGLSWGERWRLVSWLEQIWDGSLQLAADLEQRTAESWLESLAQSRSALQTIWNPLARWLTGNDVRQLSADALVTALQQFFLSPAANSRIWVPREPWARLFVQPMSEALARAGATMRLGTSAVGFDYHEDRITGVRMKDGASLQADWYVAAIAAHQLTPLLPERWLTRYAYFQHVVDLIGLPYDIIQVRADERITAPRYILIGTGPFPWIACKPSERDGSLVAVLAMPRDQSVTDSEQQVSTLLCSLKLLRTDGQLTGFRQQDATHGWLALPPGTKLRRPIQRSPISNLILAGAWTDTGWPTNLESAIVSGERCAEIILERRPA
ncbi:MAG TPA: FAD-dependent oxidoreductase, partial [Nitrospira sp.]|nr:FAD-dependent oxidoreductase [Nitrospira sp.]